MLAYAWESDTQKGRAVAGDQPWRLGLGTGVPRAPAGPTGCRQRGDVLRPRAARQGQAHARVRRRLTLGRLAAWGLGPGLGMCPLPLSDSP